MLTLKFQFIEFIFKFLIVYNFCVILQILTKIKLYQNYKYFTKINHITNT